MTKQSVNYQEDLHRAFEMPRTPWPSAGAHPGYDLREVLRKSRAEALGTLAPKSF